MHQIKRFFTILLIAGLGFQGLFLATISADQYTVLAQNVEQATDNQKVLVEVFVRPDCQHCHEEQAFLDKLGLERNDFEARFYDISEEQYYQQWEALAQMEKLSKVTPITLIGNTVIQGFDVAETTGKRIEELITKSWGKETKNIEAFLSAGGSGQVETVLNGTCDDATGVCNTTYEPLLIRVPFIGTVIDVKEYSLPILSIILGFIDGFNPCAMWVLITFLIVLMEVGSRRKIWQIAGIFIVAETAMYYLILNAWLYTWDFVGLDNIITPIVGFVAIGGGIFFLHQWWTSDGTCKITSLDQKRKTSLRIKDLVNRDLTFVTILGILMLAFSVNIIEFACSIGIPQTFTKILDMSALDVITRQFYMFLYIIFYMVDDFIVFGIALYSMEKIGLTSKYASLSHMIGGVLMLILGFILIFEPTWLAF